jgi:hypothetical protein
MGWDYAIQWLTVLPFEISAATLTLEYWRASRNLDHAVWVTVFLVMLSIIQVNPPMSRRVRGDHTAVTWLCETPSLFALPSLTQQLTFLSLLGIWHQGIRRGRIHSFRDQDHRVLWLYYPRYHHQRWWCANRQPRLHWWKAVRSTSIQEWLPRILWSLRHGGICIRWN